MEFEYAEELKKLSVDCPPKHYKAKDMGRVYRWVFDEIDDSKNFLPTYFTDPRIGLKPEDEKCSRLALSMFISEGEAEARFKHLLKEMGRSVYKKLGTKLAIGMLTKEDGVNGEPDQRGHFNHHPFKGRHYEKRFVIIKSL